MKNKGIKLRKRSKPIPNLSQAFYKEYKLYDELELNDLRVLISNKKKEIKYDLKNSNLKQKENYYKFKKDKSIIKLIDRIYEIKINEGTDNTQEINIKEYNWLVYYFSISKILNQLGYTNNTLYKEEANLICKSFQKLFEIKFMDSEEKEIILCIVKEILEHYNAKFDEERIIKDYNIDENKFYNYYLSIHKWCQKNYWKK